MADWTAADLPDLAGQTVVVTGANSGVGLEAAREFAGAGAHVVLACRRVDAAEAARDDIAADHPGASLTVRELDLADLESVEAFAVWAADALGPIDVLCNNAGVMALPRRETADGFEQQFGVNHLGHVALTGLLFEQVRAAPDPRVVTQSSGAHIRGDIDFDDLHGESSYDKWAAYAQSKLANLLFAYELDRRYDDVTSVGCHPGYAATNLQYRGPEAEGSRLRWLAMKVANTLLAQSAAAGALPMLYAATADDVEGGDYVGPGGLLNARGRPEIQESAGRSYDEATAERLWRVSVEATGVEFP